MKSLCLCIIVALLYASAADAATPIYWTPKHMAAALISLQYPHPGTFSGVCAGRSKAKHGAFAAFRCAMNWQIDGQEATSGKMVVWAKPLAHGRVCGSTSSLAGCAPLRQGPLANDPTVCSGSPSACAQAASERIVAAKAGPGTANLSCSQGVDVYHWTCTTLNKGTFTVVWSKGVSQWTATVTP